MRPILVLNSLDARYGSTYRIRALARILAEGGYPVTYVEREGSAPSKLFAGIRAALGKYDILFTQKFNPVTLAAALIARLRGKPVFVDWDDDDTGLQGTLSRRLLTGLCERFGPSLATEVTTHSEVIRDHARGRGYTAHLVPQGFEEHLFRPDAALRRQERSRLGFQEEEFVVGHLCTLTHGGAKDLPLILQAWSQVQAPQIRFLLIGGGPLETEIRDEIRRLGLEGRTRLTGIVPHESVPAHLACLDAGVVFMRDTPANRARVSFKVIEYLAMNLLVIGQVVGETDRRFGDAILRADTTTLAERLNQAAASASHRPGVVPLERYRWSHIGPDLLSVFAPYRKEGALCR